MKHSGLGESPIATGIIHQRLASMRLRPRFVPRRSRGHHPEERPQPCNRGTPGNQPGSVTRLARSRFSNPKNPSARRENGVKCPPDRPPENIDGEAAIPLEMIEREGSLVDGDEYKRGVRGAGATALALIPYGPPTNPVVTTVTPVTNEPGFVSASLSRMTSVSFFINGRPRLLAQWLIRYSIPSITSAAPIIPGCKLSTCGKRNFEDSSSRLELPFNCGVSYKEDRAKSTSKSRICRPPNVRCLGARTGIAVRPGQWLGSNPTVGHHVLFFRAAVEPAARQRPATFSGRVFQDFDAAATGTDARAWKFAAFVVVIRHLPHNQVYLLTTTEMPREHAAAPFCVPTYPS